MYASRQEPTDRLSITNTEHTFCQIQYILPHDLRVCVHEVKENREEGVYKDTHTEVCWLIVVVKLQLLLG